MKIESTPPWKRAAPWRNKMNSIEKHVLRNLRDIDVENLACGRITDIAHAEASNRSREKEKGWINHVIIADELNDMMEHSKAVINRYASIDHEMEAGWVEHCNPY